MSVSIDPRRVDAVLFDLGGEPDVGIAARLDDAGVRSARSDSASLVGSADALDWSVDEYEGAASVGVDVACPSGPTTGLLELEWALDSTLTRSAQYADDDHRVVRSTAATADGRHEIGVVAVEAALHLVEEPLLLFGKWHLGVPFEHRPYDLGIDAYE